MPEQLSLFKPVEPSKELLEGTISLYSAIETLWNMAIDERSEAPAGQKTDLRRLVGNLESMLITIEDISERHGCDLKSKESGI